MNITVVLGSVTKKATRYKLAESVELPGLWCIDKTHNYVIDTTRGEIVNIVCKHPIKTAKTPEELDRERRYEEIKQKAREGKRTEKSP